MGRAENRQVRARLWLPIKIVATSGRVTVEDDDLPDSSVFLPKPSAAPRWARRCEQWPALPDPRGSDGRHLEIPKPVLLIRLAPH
jgi:hypothetical protein